MIDLERARNDLLDEAKGYFVIPGLFSAEEVNAYRERCDGFMRHGRRIQARIITDTISDYVHLRSHDAFERTARIYQHFHNHRHDETGKLFARAVGIRDEIEKIWLDHPVYRSEKETLFDYVIVTQYLGDKGMLKKHRDYEGPAPFPLIQFWTVLSEPGKDYEGGNLVLYSKNGASRRVEADLGLRKGDALVFDKTLPHEVELTRTPGDGALGRWTVLIGARAHRDSAWQALRKRCLFGPPLRPALSAAQRMMKQALMSSEKLFQRRRIASGG
jgi:hypothetical protein